MNILFFEGPAGTGKTTELIKALESHIIPQPLSEGQKILALTFMHGARRRLEEKISKIKSIRGKYVCQTIDSFAWRVVNRWRDLAKTLKYPLPNDEIDFDTVCGCCSNLIQNDIVIDWINSSFPIIVIDEIQDCCKIRIEIIKGLSKKAHVFAAADEFQDLYCKEECYAVTWLKQNGRGNLLNENHRTDCKGILDASNAIRNGKKITEGKGLRIFPGRNSDAAAGIIACSLTWYRCHDAVILCPVTSEKSKFYKDIIERLKKKPIKPSALKGKEVGPFRIEYEQQNMQVVDEIHRKVKLNGIDDNIEIGKLDLDFADSFPGIQELAEWFDNEKRLTGKIRHNSKTVKKRVEWIVHQAKAFSHQKTNCIKAMTIHQAKNREFSNVIIIWPFEIRKGDEYRRRIFYNAVTRAKHNCTVIIQIFKKNRDINTELNLQ